MNVHIVTIFLVDIKYHEKGSNKLNSLLHCELWQYRSWSFHWGYKIRQMFAYELTHPKEIIEF